MLASLEYKCQPFIALLRETSVQTHLAESQCVHGPMCTRLFVAKQTQLLQFSLDFLSVEIDDLVDRRYDFSKYGAGHSAARRGTHFRQTPLRRHPAVGI